MKQRILASLLAPIMAFLLCACGSDQPTPNPSYNDNSPASDEPYTADEIAKDPTETTGAAETPDPGSSTPDTQNPNPAPADPDKPEGLIILTTSSGSSVGATDIIISSIAVDAGNFQTISKFTVGNIHGESTVSGSYVTPEGSGNVIGGGYYATRREWFDDDYDRMAITWMDSASAEVHAGWLDVDGEFFDVTVALGLEAKSDFDSPTKHNAIGFSEDGYFVYKSLVGDGPNAFWEFYHVPLDNLFVGAVESGIWLPGAGEDFQSQNRGLRFSDYDSGSGRLLLNTSASVSHLCSGTDDAGETYVPGDSRLSWNGVFSPDGASVAFMSKPNKGGAVDIYTMPLSGGDPVKINTDNIDLAIPEDCIKGYYASGVPCSMLISWE